MLWFILGLISFFLLAITTISDKFILSKSKLSPINYAFLVSVLGAVASVILIFIEPKFSWPAGQVFTITLAGAGFFFGVYFQFLVFNEKEATRVNSIINSLIPILTFFMSQALIVDHLTTIKLAGVGVIVFSSYLLSQVGLKKDKFNYRNIVLMFLAALMFAANHVFSKVVYEERPFFDSFIWIRWSILAVGIVYITLTGNWRKIFPKSQKVPKEKASVKTQWFVLFFGQACGAVSVLLYQYAVKLGSVTLVTALQGTQFLFMLIMAFILTRYYPKLFKEDISRKILIQKIIYSILLCLGVVLIIL
jgi:drug/metabolite transporter (DMT)-like permease